VDSAQDLQPADVGHLQIDHGQVGAALAAGADAVASDAAVTTANPACVAIC